MSGREGEVVPEDRRSLAVPTVWEVERRVRDGSKQGRLSHSSSR